MIPPYIGAHDKADIDSIFQGQAAKALNFTYWLELDDLIDKKSSSDYFRNNLSGGGNITYR